MSLNLHWECLGGFLQAKSKKKVLSWRYGLFYVTMLGGKERQIQIYFAEIALYMVRNFLLIIGITLLFSGCAQTDLTGPVKESSIPWNRPANWEGAGALGGFSGMRSL